MRIVVCRTIASMRSFASMRWRLAGPSPSRQMPESSLALSRRDSAALANDRQKKRVAAKFAHFADLAAALEDDEVRNAVHPVAARDLRKSIHIDLREDDLGSGERGEQVRKPRREEFAIRAIRAPHVDHDEPRFGAEESVDPRRFAGHDLRKRRSVDKSHASNPSTANGDHDERQEARGRADTR